MKTNVCPTEIEQRYFLLASIGAFANQFEAEIGKHLGEITWKQYCLLNEIRRFDQSPSIAELAESLGTSRQNIKEILLKLKQKKFVILVYEDNNKKRQRIKLTEKCNEYFARYNDNVTRLVNEALQGVSSDQVQISINIINQIRMNIENNSLVKEEVSPIIKIITWDGKQIEASHFRICKLQPRLKGQPKYQLYASKGSVIQVSGINRYIIGFYDNDDSIQREIYEINQARQNNESEYEVKYFEPVHFSKGDTVFLNK